MFDAPVELEFVAKDIWLDGDTIFLELNLLKNDVLDQLSRISSIRKDHKNYFIVVEGVRRDSNPRAFYDHLIYGRLQASKEQKRVLSLRKKRLFVFLSQTQEGILFCCNWFFGYELEEPYKTFLTLEEVYKNPIKDMVI
jgi:hypothetical protein